MSDFNIANYDEVEENIRKTLKEIYLGAYTDYNGNISFIGYYNTKTQMAWFDLDSTNYPDVETLPITDDVICIGTLYEVDIETSDIFDFWFSIGELADTVGMTKEQLIKTVAEEMGEDEDFVEYDNVRDYVEKHYYDKVVAEYKQLMEDENFFAFSDKARDIMFDFEDKIKDELTVLNRKNEEICDNYDLDDNYDLEDLEEENIAKYGIYKATHTALEPPKELSEVIIADEFIGYPCIGSPIEVFNTEEAAVARLNEKYSSSIEKVARPIQNETDKRFYSCTVFFVAKDSYSHEDIKEILQSRVPERIKIAKLPFERNIKVEPAKFIIEEQGKQVEIDGCKIIMGYNTAYLDCEDYKINFFVAAEFPEYKYYFDEDIFEKMKEEAQRNHYQWYSSDKIIKEDVK